MYKVSNVHPYVSIVSPSNYAWVSGVAYPITIYNGDINLDNLKIYVNWVLKQTLFDDAAIGYITYRLDTREYANGSTVEVKAVLTDLDGFSDYDLVYVKIDNEPPYAEITYPANNSIIGASTNVTIDVGDALAFFSRRSIPKRYFSEEHYCLRNSERYVRFINIPVQLNS